MKKSSRFPIVLLGAALALLAADPVAAQFRDLVSHVPNGANALVILNVEKILASPLGERQGWKANLEKAFAAGMIRVPPKAQRFVLAAQIDFEFMKPTWEAAVADVQRAPSMEKIAKEYKGTPDKFVDTEAVVLPNDAYVMAVSQNTLAAMSPANRQVVARWIQEWESPSKLSDYLRKAAGYADDAATEIILALDLEGVFPPAQIDRYLKSKKSPDGSPPGLAGLSRLLASLDGLRVGIRIGEKPFGKLTVDFRDPVTSDAQTLKKLLLGILADGGMMIDDLNEWKPEIQGTTFSLSGNLSSGGMRKILSFVESPAPAETAAKASPGDAAANQGKATLSYYKTVEKYLGDLKGDMRDLKTMGQAAGWCDKYARKIEKLPLLGVDPEMLDYGKFIATALRGGALNTRNTNIQTGAQQYQVAGNTGVAYDPSYYGGYGSGRGGYGGGWYGGPVAGRAAVVSAAKQELNAEIDAKRVMRTQARANIAGDLQSIKAQIVQVTNDIRRKMTERYKIEF
jgi:hypothetical protein